MTESVEGPATNQLQVSSGSPISAVQQEVIEESSLEDGVKAEIGSDPTIMTSLPLIDQTTLNSPSLTNTVSALEDLPELPESQPTSRPTTPNIVVEPPNESTPLQFPESRSTRKVDVSHLRLPSNIPREEGLPLLSQGEFVGNEYIGGVSLRSGSETSFMSSESPILTGTSASHTIDDIEDADPNVSSFGDGSVQAIPVAQVGLRSPMFPSGSGSHNLLGAINHPAQRFSSQLSHIDESPSEPQTPEGMGQLGSSPPAEGDPQVGGGEKGEDPEKKEGEVLEKKEGEEGEGEEGWGSLSWIARQFKS